MQLELSRDELQAILSMVKVMWEGGHVRGPDVANTISVIANKAMRAINQDSNPEVKKPSV